MTNQNLMELGCSNENCQDSTYPQSLFLESLRTGIFLMELEMVSGYSKYPREALLQVSSRSNIRKLVKTHLSSKSFLGVLENRNVLGGAGDGVTVLKISQGSFTISFIKI